MKNFSENIKLAIIVPCLDEQEILTHTQTVLSNIILKLINQNIISIDSKIIYIDDGSEDSTWNLIEDMLSNNEIICGIKLTKNYGHQNALYAAFNETVNLFDIFITIDADLQDDPELIPKMIHCYQSGSDIVYGVRESRNTDSIFKLLSADLFYRLINVFGAKLIPHHADFRLLSNKVLNSIIQYKETNLFLRGIVTDIGYESTKVFYTRTSRKYGESKYTLLKMISFAWNGFTSFSAAPLRWILYLGVIMSMFSIFGMLWIISVYFMGKTIQGWSSIIIMVLFFGGINMFALGVIGEYIRKIFIETKKRPLYLVEKKIGKTFNHELF